MEFGVLPTIVGPIMIMLRSLALLCVLGLTAPLALISCDGDDDKKEAAPVVTYGVLKTSLLDSTEVRVVDLTSAACTSSSDTGLFTGVFTAATGEALDIKIKDFSTTPRTYTCVQAETNRDGDLGEKYSGCAIEFTVKNATTGFDTYATYRTADTQDAFTYAGACTVTTAYASGKVTLAVTCGDLIQTKVRSQTRFPISASEVASAAAGTSVECAI